MGNNSIRYLEPFSLRDGRPCLYVWASLLLRVRGEGWGSERCGRGRQGLIGCQPFSWRGNIVRSLKHDENKRVNVFTEAVGTAERRRGEMGWGTGYSSRKGKSAQISQIKRVIKEE